MYHQAQAFLDVKVERSLHAAIATVALLDQLQLFGEVADLENDLPIIF